MTRSLHLSIPNLLEAPPETRALDVPCLARCLTCALLRGSETTSSAALCAQFGVVASRNSELPIASITYALDHGTAPEGECWRIDPVYVVADRGALVMWGQHALALSLDEARRIVDDINAHFQGEAWRIEPVTPLRWYLRTTSSWTLRAPALEAVVGKSVFEHLPTGADAARWRAVMNEIQMLLHSHPVNVAREAQGAPPVNSVWLWGGGRMPEAPAQRWAQVWSDDVLALALAKLAHSPRASPPRDAREWLRHAITPGDHLIVLPALPRDTESWAAGMRRMEHDWFGLLTAALKDKQLTRLTLDSLDGRVFEITPRDLRRWWVRTKPLTDFLRRVEE